MLRDDVVIRRKVLGTVVLCSTGKYCKVLRSVEFCGMTGSVVRRCKTP